MNKQEKTIAGGLIIILIFLIFQLAYTVFNYFDYEERKKSGNERWLQVEERIKAIEECCECKK